MQRWRTNSPCSQRPQASAKRQRSTSGWPSAIHTMSRPGRRCLLKLLSTQPLVSTSTRPGVTLDEGDNDPARFWRSIIAACQSFHADLGRSALALLFSSLQPLFELPSREMMLTFLLNDITHHLSSGLLVLDDYHLITEPRIHHMLTFFIDHLPASLHVILLTRSEPPLPLVRWRARGELHDIHTADLRFSPEETATFLQQAVSSGLKASHSDEAIGQLARGMEGWVAGLRLLLLTLPRQTERGSELERHLALLANSPENLGGHPPTHPQRVVVEYFV